MLTCTHGRKNNRTLQQLTLFGGLCVEGSAGAPLVYVIVRDAESFKEVSDNYESLKPVARIVDAQAQQLLRSMPI